MPLPKPISVQTIAGLTKDPLNFEAHKQIIAGQNQLIASLGPGAGISPQNFALSKTMGNSAKVTGTSGTFKRGKFTVTVGTVPGANPDVTINFPGGTWNNTPFAQVVRNGGTGTKGFSYTESVNTLIVTLSGTPIAGETYTFQYAVRE